MINVSNDLELVNILSNIKNIMKRNGKVDFKTYRTVFGDLSISTRIQASGPRYTLYHPDFEFTFHYIKKNVVVWLNKGQVQHAKEILMFALLSS